MQVRVLPRSLYLLIITKTNEGYKMNERDGLNPNVGGAIVMDGDDFDALIVKMSSPLFEIKSDREVYEVYCLIAYMEDNGAGEEIIRLLMERLTQGIINGVSHIFKDLTEKNSNEKAFLVRDIVRALTHGGVKTVRTVSN